MDSEKSSANVRLCGEKRSLRKIWLSGGLCTSGKQSVCDQYHDESRRFLRSAVTGCEFMIQFRNEANARKLHRYSERVEAIHSAVQPNGSGEILSELGRESECGKTACT